ncbi:conserved membrane hypothetical protein [uncultured Eubacteriales bacterium]|uniref:DUF3796 domain-containing protein n=1 Tax=uncultured Eubacteriales bacterium TaxID=172733 RepID=A0A212KGL0_9FIRM|nr:conserved membrane hypothetical protein [uncultured Eubacteriales bacterium]
MKLRWSVHGLMGLLSLLGFVGVFTESRAFLAFFAFAVDFEYFFIKSDEMLEEFMNKSASMAFYAGMVVTAAVTLAAFLFGRGENSALTSGLAWGWIAAVLVHALSSAYYGFRERWGMEDDKE